MSRNLKSVLKVGSNTLLSRILGFVRDIVLAHLFGAGPMADAFFVALRIPNLFRRLFGEGAFSQAFIPVLGEYRSQRSPADTRAFVEDVSGWLALTLVVVTVIGIVAAPILVLLIAPGFAADASKFHLTVELLRITFPYLFLVSLVALAGAVLNTYGHFTVPAFSPVFLNLGIIGAALLWAPHSAQPAVAVAWGVTLGGVAQLLFQIPALRGIGHLHWPRLRRRDPGVAKVLRLMGPAAFGASVAQVNLFLNTILASLVGANVVSYLYYSDRLVEFPLGVFGVALGTVVLPMLSRQAASGSSEFPATLDWGLRWTWLVGFPATLGLVLLAEPLLITLFHYGAYTAEDAAQSALSLVGYGLGIVPIIAARVLAPAFYARQDTRTPVRFGVISVLVNVVVSLMLAWHFRQLGLALATTLAALVNSILLARRLSRDGVYRPFPGWWRFLRQTSLASGAMGLFLWWGRGAHAQWLHWGLWDRLVHLLLLIGSAIALYFFLLWAQRLPELRELRRPQ
ncbi:MULTISPECIES: murein biosynthesis integral membrane protein MurJ [Acidithiobacillus]|uniref:murein biosynthesis integral membrane protein MurJ n=1 Tax=Acidithiobacillus TaxID=119977 RepID=UPI0009C0CB04|nr:MULTISPECIES: murein biosynthesis integral membrane protein MurJ [Acidithiobacillus]AUW32238.1 murein biosynthesis integral membrane protein MurJ [Acidithiobacillus caldus]MBU2731087.1 murein biosynthesis integral membrane protein MurJ [Acidithiobacillus caldus]MBU2735070.1 murein biosynthesis integral membrane protein MurJ [Acidithiobacillus caldus ATCC 51756]MBU2746449.1 murein biosynthesis integral membrane protein MurJ [Acidithiobacillus caldus]MBU2764139.1 murein biosynthesis integral 